MKNLMIIGDSYSTFDGYIPKGYAVYYSKAKREGNDVNNVSDTWWHKLAKKADLNVILNDSWSGSTVGYTGYGGADCRLTSSFIYRFEKYYREGFFDANKIDTLLIFGGTNDSWANVKLGEIKLDSCEEGDLYTVLPAICHIIRRAKEVLPGTRIIYIINCDIKPEIGDAVKSASAHYGTEYVELHGVTKVNGHPTSKGMGEICDAVLSVLTKS